MGSSGGSGPAPQARTSCCTAPTGSRGSRPHSPALPGKALPTLPVHSQAARRTPGGGGRGEDRLKVPFKPGGTMALSPVPSTPSPLPPPPLPHQLETDTQAIGAGVFRAGNPCPIGASGGCHPLCGEEKRKLRKGEPTPTPQPALASVRRTESLGQPSSCSPWNSQEIPLQSCSGLRLSWGAKPQGKRPRQGGSWAEPVGPRECPAGSCPSHPLSAEGLAGRAKGTGGALSQHRT